MENLYTVQEVSKLLKVSKNRVYDMIHAGLLPVMKMGGIKVRESALEAFLQKYEGYDITDPQKVNVLDVKELFWQLKKL